MQGEQDVVDYLKTNFQHKNRDQYIQLIRQTLSKQQSKPSQQIQPALEQYTEEYRNFMHNFNFTSNNKANALIEEALNDVHPGLKTKKQCKVILSIVAKIFCQELIEECVEVKEQYKAKKTNGLMMNNITNGDKNTAGNHQTPNKKNQKPTAEIDIDVLQEAYRRRLLKKEKI